MRNTSEKRCEEDPLVAAVCLVLASYFRTTTDRVISMILDERGFFLVE
jgi:hypothetical protein